MHNDLPVIILGAGGHARVLLDTLVGQCEVKGFLTPDAQLWGDTIMGRPVLGNDDYLRTQDATTVRLVNALGSTKSNAARHKLFQTWQLRGYRFATIIHPRATVSERAVVSEGVQVMAGAVVNTGAQLGPNTIINSGAIVEHDCYLGESVHVAPGAVLLGGVSVGSQTHIGASATVLQTLTVGERCLVAAGAVVVKSVKAEQTVMGVPAKVML